MYLETRTYNPNLFFTKTRTGKLNLGKKVVQLFNSVDALSDLQPWQTPYAYCSNNPMNRVDPTGMIDGWFENERTGQLMNVKGSSVIPSSEQGKGWVGIGPDDKFGSKNIPKGEDGTVTKMDFKQSSQFMSGQGYEMVPKQFLEESITTKRSYPMGGGHSHSQTEGFITQINEKITYTKKGNEISNIKEATLYGPKKGLTIDLWTTISTVSRKEVSYGEPDRSFIGRILNSLSGSKDQTSRNIYSGWNKYPASGNLNKYRP